MHEMCYRWYHNTSFKRHFSQNWEPLFKNFLHQAPRFQNCTSHLKILCMYKFHTNKNYLKITSRQPPHPFHTHTHSVLIPFTNLLSKNIISVQIRLICLKKLLSRVLIEGIMSKLPNWSGSSTYLINRQRERKVTLSARSILYETLL